MQKIPWFQIGQSHGGFIGFMQTILQKASHHIWFERGETKDRVIVVNRSVSPVLFALLTLIK